MHVESVSEADSPSSAAAPLPQKPPTPWIWRAGIGILILILGGLAYVLRDTIGPRGQAVTGIFCFFGLVAMFSSNLRAVNWRTIGWGIVLQIILALLVLRAQFTTHSEPSTLVPADIQDVRSLTTKLSSGSDNFSLYLKAQLSSATQQTLTNDLSANANLQSFKESVVKDLNKVLAGPSIFDPERFRGIQLRPETQKLLAQKPEGKELAHLNRLLLDDAYPQEMSKVRVHRFAGLFESAKEVVVQFINFSDKGAEFVFGNLARPGDIALNPGKEMLFMFAFKALPPILFISAFFTMLYHYGVLQRIVRLMSFAMVHLMRTSGAETLSVSANVFMGQTEAPLIVKPYVPRMTQSELFALMVSGMAHISGALMVVYISYGADPLAVLTTCIMACPCSLYLAKLFMPETSVPETAGIIHRHREKSPFVNGIDAITAGTTDGLSLALNVAAMLIVFIAFVAMFDAILGWIHPGWSLGALFGWLFSPAAFLMGVELKDVPHVATLLGAKLSVNEHYAYLVMKGWKDTPNFMTERSYTLAAFALTGFANFASVGIQLGGIGAIAPGRRHDLARLGLRALFVGFMATLLNAAIAGVFLK
jgi:CNT family concentrative nucleoside transporter